MICLDAAKRAGPGEAAVAGIFGLSVLTAVAQAQARLENSVAVYIAPSLLLAAFNTCQ